MGECHTSDTEASVQFPLCRITRELSIVLRYAYHVSNPTFEEWVPPMVVALPDVPAVHPPSQSQDLSLHTWGPVQNSVRECTRLLLPHRALPPPITAGGKDLALRGATTGVRQDDAGTTRSTGPSQQPVPEGSPHYPLLREKVLRSKQKYFLVETKNVQITRSLNNSTRLTDAVNDLRTFSSSVARVSTPPSTVPTGWVGRGNLFKTRFDSICRSVNSDTLSFLEHAFSSLNRTLTNGTSGPEAFQLFVCQINLPYLEEVSPLNLVERSRTFQVKVGTTFSVYFIRLCIILNDIRATQITKDEVNLTLYMDCVQLSVLDEYRTKAAKVYPGELSKARLPYVSLADPHRAFKRATPRQSKTKERSPEGRAPGEGRTPRNSGSRPRSNESPKSQGDNSQSMAQVRSIARTYPFVAHFKGRTASIRPGQ